MKNNKSFNGLGCNHPRYGFNVAIAGWTRSKQRAADKVTEALAVADADACDRAKKGIIPYKGKVSHYSRAPIPKP